MYCERYMIAFEEFDIGEMVVHAPPLNILCLSMLPFILFKSKENEEKVMKYGLMNTVSNWFSYFIFWGENILFVGFFTAFELILLPVLYLRCLFNLIYSTPGLFTTVAYVITWLLVGILYLMVILI